jgi:hypothetical protein
LSGVRWVVGVAKYCSWQQMWLCVGEGCKVNKNTQKS